MQISARGINLEVSPELRRHAESRLWTAADRSPRRVGWASVVLERDEEDADRRVTCRADAWLREFGLVTASASGPDPFRAVDRAGRQLEQAIVRHARRAARLPLPAGSVNGDATSPWHADERQRNAASPRGNGGGSAAHGRDSRRARSDACPFLDFDPVTPDWPR